MRRSRAWEATSSRCSWTQRIRPLRTLSATVAEIHDAGGLAIPAHPLVPYPLCAQGWVIRGLLDRSDERFHPDAAGDVQPDDAWPAMAFAGGPLRRGERPGDGRQQRRARARRDRCRVDRVPGPDSGRHARRRSSPTRRSSAGRSTGRRARSARSAASSRSTAAMRTRGSRAGSCAMAPVAISATRPSTVRSTRHGDEDRPRLPVHLPRRRRRRAARRVPLREPPPARPRRADHHRQPRPAALVGG